MADVLIRNVPEPVKRRLKARAEHNGRSLQSELNDILSQAAAQLLEPSQKDEEPLSVRIKRRFKDVGIDLNPAIEELREARVPLARTGE
jgi:plasmid stability protein